jgi:cobalamin biosynthesis Mg chelatase CobN
MFWSLCLRLYLSPEEKEKQQRIEQEKRREEEKECVEGEEEDGEQPEEKSSGSKTKLKASDIYSDDSGSETDKSDKAESQKRSSSSSTRSSSDSESDKKWVFFILFVTDIIGHVICIPLAVCMVPMAVKGICKCCGGILMCSFSYPSHPLLKRMRNYVRQL